MDSENSAYEYSFSLWGSLTGYSQPVRLEKCIQAFPTSLLRAVGAAVLRDCLGFIKVVTSLHHSPASHMEGTCSVSQPVDILHAPSVICTCFIFRPRLVRTISSPGRVYRFLSIHKLLMFASLMSFGHATHKRIPVHITMRVLLRCRVR